MASIGPLPVVHLSLLVIRVISGLALIYYQGWEQFKLGWAYLWQGGAWPLVERFSDSSTPVATFCAIMIAVFYFVAPLFLVLGFLTRLNALMIFTGLLITLMAEGSLHMVISRDTLTVQAMLLHLSVMFLFILNGGGIIALDRFFDRRRGRDKRAGGLYA